MMNGRSLGYEKEQIENERKTEYLLGFAHTLNTIADIFKNDN